MDNNITDNADVSSLRKLQLAELDIMKSVIKAFDQHGIKYFLGYGTLLGAVRHQGFIPWDDDVDLFLPRPDFDRFIEIADQILEKPFFLNREPMPMPICLKHYRRIEDPTRHHIRLEGTTKKDYNTRIDIFPLDGAPKSSVALRWLFFRAAVMRVLVRFCRSYAIGVGDKKHSAAESFGIWLNKHFKIGKRLSAVKMADHLEAIRKRYDYDTASSVYAWVPDYSMKRIVCKKEWFGEGKKAAFEDAEFVVPENSDAVLRQFYGDYMTPPPAEAQVCKHIVGVVEDDI